MRQLDDLGQRGDAPDGGDGADRGDARRMGDRGLDLLQQAWLRVGQ